MTVIKDMVSYVTHALADHPNAIRLSETVTDDAVALELRVAPDDMGRIIGRRGRTINAVRDVARVLGGALDKKTDLELIEPPGRQRR